MGNGSSQSVVLGQSRTLGHSIYPDTRYQRAPKYAHPHNRVLPKPVAGQRLRSTDNGHILHSAGTIRGLKPGSPVPQSHDEGDPEVIDILKRRSEMIEKEQQHEDYHQQMNLRSHRMFYSDPDISRSRPTSSGYSPEVAEIGAARRIVGAGAAAKANKLKQRKKAKAPDPPPLGNGFQGQFQRRTQSSMDISMSRDQKDSDCRCPNGVPEWKPKSKAPPPPPVANPPKPPPLPSLDRTPRQDQRNSSSNQPASSSRTAACSPRLKNFNHSPRDTRQGSTDVRLRDDRTTVFNSKADLSAAKAKKPALLPHPPDPFQKEIEAVTKRIAESRQRDPKPSTEETKRPSDQVKEPQKVNSPKQYYFSDKDVFRIDHKVSRPNPDVVSEGANVPQREQKSQCVAENVSRLNAEIKADKLVEVNEESPLQRFPAFKRKGNSSSTSSSPLGDQKPRVNGVDTCDNDDDDQSDIDVRLRPVLPRKTPQIPKFSATEAWQALGSDGQGSSNHSTSDESIPRYLPQNNRFPRKNEPDTKSDNRSSYLLTPNGSHWTPRQDLDDSDTSSCASEEVVIPRNQLGEFSTRFSLPTVMFSNMRPIGTDGPSNRRSNERQYRYYNGDSGAFGAQKKKPRDSSSHEMNSVSQFRRFLGMRNKYLNEEDVCVSDSNWTFGGYGLNSQKRSKQYSSDLMLSDKKKYDLVVKNNYEDLFGDVLATKANNGRNRTKIPDRKPDFSFYSTEGHVMYLPEVSPTEDFPRNRSSYSGRKFVKTDQAQPATKNCRKGFGASSNKQAEKAARSQDIFRMLEDEVRRKRNKEKIAIRQQLRMMKHLESDEETEDEVDEAYFTEPKSLEGSSPLHLPSSEVHLLPELAPKYEKMRNEVVSSRCAAPSTPLKHWTSSPALFDDQSGQSVVVSSRGFHSSSSINSSPDPGDASEKWLKKKQLPQGRRNAAKQRRVSEGDSSPAYDSRLGGGVGGGGPSAKAKDPTKAVGKTKEKKNTSIYKQLMDIVRREERHLKKTQELDGDRPSRDSSYSQRESSHSSSSHDSVSSSSSNSYSDSSCGAPAHDEPGKSGVPANNEFHSATGLDVQGQRQQQESRQARPSSYHAAFAQPFTANKSYRPVPFEVAVPAANNCRMPALQESHKSKAESSQMYITTE